MKKTSFLLCLTLFVTVCVFPQGNQYIKRFKIIPNDLELSRLAQPSQYFDKIGQKAALMGREDGTFELWIWPWKVLRNFQLQFLLDTSTQPISARDIVKQISVTPEATILTYVYESFTVKQIIIVPRFEQCVIILLDVHTTVPLSIVSSFIPILQPQWPAGIGGQYSFWQNDAKACVISESQRRALFLCGSPASERMALTPAHMLADTPMQFKISIQPEEVPGHYIPIVITGGSAVDIDSLKILFSDYSQNAEKYYKENVDYYKALRRSTLQILTPDEHLNLAYEWGKVALHNLLVTNHTLGTGLVAGYGMSGRGGRPGFAWYFGGDAFINTLALNGFGDYATVRKGLAFAQKWQRQEDFPIRKKRPGDPNIDVGKMAHELSQSDGIIDWWHDYHYGYNHADTTPWYLTAVGDYFRKTGDIDFIQKSWPSILQAYRWCLSKDSDGDGLMDLKGAGLGVLEFGPLVKIHNDIYTQGIWTQGLKELIFMAKHLGDQEIQLTVEKQFEKAKASLERNFWMEDLGFYSFGANANGERVREKSIWPSAIIMFELLDPKKSVSTLKAFNASDMVTDWGIRNLSNQSSLYEPTNYNYGTVWPFVSAFTVTSLYKWGFDLQGWSTLKSTCRHIFDFGLGVVPEVFSGDINTKLAEAYHNQGFSVTGFMLPILRGLCGLELNVPDRRIIFAPRFPADWHKIKIQNIQIPNGTVNLKLLREGDVWTLCVEKSEESEWIMAFKPQLPLGTKVRSAQVNGYPVDYRLLKNEQTFQLDMEFVCTQNCTLTYNIDPSIELVPVSQPTPPGALNQNMKVISHKLKGNKHYLWVEGFCGKTVVLPIRHSEKIRAVKGAELTDSGLIIHFDCENGHTFMKKEIIITVN